MFTRTLALALLIAGLLSSAQPAGAAFPGHNGKIVFAQANLEDNDSNIWVMNPDGSGKTQLTSSGQDVEPAWSADGAKIVFSSGRGGNFDVYVMNADGSGLKRLTTTPTAERYPTWSPDGKKIAFSNNGVIVAMNADGTNRKQLTNTVGLNPAWSPDGKKIAYSNGANIVVMNADGTSKQNLTNASLTDEDPSWSPFGTQIAFTRRHGSEGIYLINTDGSGLEQLTTGNDAGPAWSPDNLQISFDRRDSTPNSQDWQIWTMNATGTGQAAVTADPAIDIDADWQPLPYTLADLVLRLTARRSVCLGCQIRYQMKIANRGPSPADGVVLGDPVPPGTSFVSVEASQGSCSPPAAGARAVTCALGLVDPRAHATVRLIVRVDGGDTIGNTATVSAATDDPNLEDNSAALVTTVRR